MLVAAAFALPSGADEMDPVANPEACVVAGNARFTVLTDRLVRMGHACGDQPQPSRPRVQGHP